MGNDSIRTAGVASAVRPPDTERDDPRVGRLLGNDLRKARTVIVGFPSDSGVRRNGGRPGATEAPDAIREHLYRMTPDARNSGPFTDTLDGTVDLGNLPVTGHTDEDQERLGAFLAPYLECGVIPIILGGGHETSFGHFLGYVRANLNVHPINIDAHPDVRPPVAEGAHSGSPFRQMLMHSNCSGYTVAGLQPHSTAPAHVQWMQERGCSYHWRSETNEQLLRTIYTVTTGPVMASFDLDAVDAAFAPGVSAPNAGGLTPESWLRAAYEAGACPRVGSVDLVELCPPLDQDGRSARLAALTIWTFLAGLSMRPHEPPSGGITDSF